MHKHELVRRGDHDDAADHDRLQLVIRASDAAETTPA